MNKHRGTIPCTIGILTFNSEDNLRRCLHSVDGFAEVIVADGGSTDATRVIAEEYGCVVIDQSNPGNPISDFSYERNRMLDRATYDWNFYLDSDEIMSPDLKKSIEKVARVSDPLYFVYDVRYKLINRDATKIYESFKPAYQMRLFNKSIGARFIKPMHERVAFDREVYPVARIDEPWYVPLDDQLNFSVYKNKVDHRLSVLAKKWKTKNPWTFFVKGIYSPLKSFVKQIVRMILIRFRYPWNRIVPLRYEFYRLYSPWVLMRERTKAYVRVLLGRS